VVRTYLTRGLLVGLLAGVLATGFAKVVAEPQINAAEKFESASRLAAGEPPETQVVARDVQDTLGLSTGVLVAGAALGGIYALVFAFVHGRVARTRARLSAAGVAAAAFISLVLVPFLKYPANPPAIGRADTIGHRTAIYFVLIAVAVVVLAGAVEVRRRLITRFDPWNATLAAGALFVAAIAVAYLVMPGVNEVPAAFPATVLWRFRLASLGTQVVLWTVIGLVFGSLTERHEAPLGRAVSAAAFEAS
jgi:predicted cobalt transporter CbtA